MNPYVVLGIVFAVVFVAILVLAKSYYSVPQSHVVLVERFGQYHRQLNAGINFVLPLIDQKVDLSDWEARDGKRIACKQDTGRRTVLMELAEQMTDTGSRKAITKDNVELGVDAVVYWQIIDPVSARYEVDSLPQSIVEMALNVLRTAIGGVTLDQALSERGKINQYLLHQLTKSCDKWGVRVVRVEIQELAPSEGAGAAMLEQMTAERERRARILRAQGEKEANILKAQGDKEAVLIRAEGEARAMLKLAEAEAGRLKMIVDKVDGQDGIQAALVLRYMETLSNIAKDPSSRVIVAGGGNELGSATGILASLVGDLQGRSSGEIGRKSVLPTEKIDVRADD